MAFLAAVPLWVQIAGTALTAAGAIYGGVQAKRAADAKKHQLEDQAAFEKAAGQRRAIEERRASQFARSRALAVAGASGAGVGDPTVANLLADLQTEGEYRALTQLFTGDETALGLQDQATAAGREGKAAQIGSYASATETVLGGINDWGPSLAAKYGGSGPPTSSDFTVTPISQYGPYADQYRFAT